MDLLLFRHAEYERLYNCSGVLQQLEALYPPEQRTFPICSWTLITLCAVYYVLYIPCMISIWKHTTDNSCYKMLFYIGVIDLLVLPINGFLHGYLSLSGTFFCARPTLLYVTGGLYLFFWLAESTVDFVLAINRCIEILSPNFAHTLFGGRRVWAWMSGGTLYALYYFVFTRTTVFIPIYFSVFFNPYAGLYPDTNGTYENLLHTVHNIVIAVGSPLVYVLFLVAFKVKARSFGQTTTISNTQKMVFVQVLIISCLNTVSGLIYVYMQYVSAPEYLIVLGHFAWFHIHGSPPLIYLLLNKTIRQDCKMLVLKAVKSSRISRLHGVTVVVPVGGLNNPTLGGKASKIWRGNYPSLDVPINYRPV